MSNVTLQKMQLERQVASDISNIQNKKQERTFAQKLSEKRYHKLKRDQLKYNNVSLFNQQPAPIYLSEQNQSSNLLRNMIREQNNERHEI